MPSREVGPGGALLRGRASSEHQGRHSTAKNNQLHGPQATDIRSHSDSFFWYIWFPLCRSETYHHKSLNITWSPDDRDRICETWAPQWPCWSHDKATIYSNFFYETLRTFMWNEIANRLKVHIVNVSVVAPCCVMGGYKSFKRTYCFHLQILDSEDRVTTSTTTI
jgi:hypothetical protein